MSTYTGLTSDKENLYLTDATDHIMAFSKKSGSVIWKQAALKGRSITAPVMHEGNILVADLQGYLHWVSNQDGMLVGRAFVGRKGLIASPVSVNNKVFTMTQDGRLTVLQTSSAS